MLEEISETLSPLNIPHYESIDSFLKNKKTKYSYSLSTFPSRFDYIDINSRILIPQLGGFMLATIKPTKQAKYSFSLWQNQEQVSLISYNIIDNNIDIIQKQNLSCKIATKAHISKSYSNLDLNNKMLEAVFLIAQEHNMESVRIVSGKNQLSKNHYGAIPTQFEKTYDESAIKQGFEYDESINRYIKPC